jgi:hypothetical protein
MDLHVLFDINILEGSCVDEPLAVGDDLGANEIQSVLCLPDLGKLVFEDLVEVASLCRIWLHFWRTWYIRSLRGDILRLLRRCCFRRRRANASTAWIAQTWTRKSPSQTNVRIVQSLSVTSCLKTKSYKAVSRHGHVTHVPGFLSLQMHYKGPSVFSRNTKFQGSNMHATDFRKSCATLYNSYFAILILPLFLIVSCVY